MKPSTKLKRRTPIRQRSVKHAAMMVVRAEFVRAVLEARPNCEAKLLGCTRLSQDVHEVIARGRGGAALPGEKADAQGQRFVAICRVCHAFVTDHPAKAEAMGLYMRRRATTSLGE